MCVICDLCISAACAPLHCHTKGNHMCVKSSQLNSFLVWRSPIAIAEHLPSWTYIYGPYMVFCRFQFKCVTQSILGCIFHESWSFMGASSLTIAWLQSTRVDSSQTTTWEEEKPTITFRSGICTGRASVHACMHGRAQRAPSCCKSNLHSVIQQQSYQQHRGISSLFQAFHQGFFWFWVPSWDHHRARFF